MIRASLVLLAGLTLAAPAASFGAGAAAPEGPDPTAVKVGAGIFRAYCASCHGTTAKGDGEVAQYLQVKPADLTKVTERHGGGAFPLDVVLQIIDGREKIKGHGRGEMPVWGDAFQIAGGGATPDQVKEKIRCLAHFIWSIQQ